MNVRVLNSQSGGSFLVRPPNVFATNASAGYQDVDEATAAAMVSGGFIAVAYVGTTAQRPARLGENALGLNLFIDTSISKVVALASDGWHDVVTGSAV